MEKQVELIFEKLKSDQLLVQVSGLEEAKILVGQLVHNAAQALFSSPAPNRYVLAERLYAVGHAVISELEGWLAEDAEAATYAALILLRLGSMKGVDRLIRSLRDGVGPAGMIAQTLGSAKTPGASEAITIALSRQDVRKDPYTVMTLALALRDLGSSIPDEALRILEESAPQLRRLL